MASPTDNIRITRYELAAQRPFERLTAFTGGICTVNGDGVLSPEVKEPGTPVYIYLKFQINWHTHEPVATYWCLTDGDSWWCPVYDYGDIFRDVRLKVGRPDHHERTWGERDSRSLNVSAPTREMIREACRQLGIGGI